MPLYDVLCPRGSVTEVMLRFADPLPACPCCGEPTRRKPSAPHLAGSGFAPPPSAGTIPVSWNGTGGGDSGRIAELRREVETRRTFEEKHPEHRKPTVKVAAHEGRYADAPLMTASGAGASPAAVEGS